MHASTTDPMTLAERLLEGARTPVDRAALSLLLSLTHVYARHDVVARWYDDRTADHPPVVRWDRVSADADDGTVPLSAGERAVAVIAASIAGDNPVVLSAALRQLDDSHAAGLIMAVYTLLQPPRTGPDHTRHAGAEDRP